MRNKTGIEYYEKWLNKRCGYPNYIKDNRRKKEICYEFKVRVCIDGSKFTLDTLYDLILIPSVMPFEPNSKTLTHFCIM